ncbi:hypothetical protein V2J09_005113 [Rumex salicifolius]
MKVEVNDKGPGNETNTVFSNRRTSTENNVSSYISIQTGEEFSSEFLDRLTPRAAQATQSGSHNHGKSNCIAMDQDCQMGYEDFARILGLCRMDSESSSELSDFDSSKHLSTEAVISTLTDRKQRCHIDRDDSRILPSSSVSCLNYEQGDVSQHGKLRILCSFGGKILPRPSDAALRYVGGETHIISFSKKLSWHELLSKTSRICKHAHTIKYQLPGEDLDALISISSDEDLENMLEEYNVLQGVSGSQRLRIFLIPNSETRSHPCFETSSVHQCSSDYEYVVAVNGIHDHRPWKTSIEPLRVNEGAFFDGKIDRTPSICRNMPSRQGNMNATQESPFSVRSLLPGPSYSSRLAQQRDLISGPSQLYDDSYAQDCSESVSTCGGQQLFNQTSNLQSDKMQFLASVAKFNNNFANGCHLGLVSPENGTLHREKSMSQDDRVCLLGSTDPIAPHHGMTHAFSDSQLQQYEEKYAYCSQDAIWDKHLQLQENSNPIDMGVLNKMEDIKSSHFQEQADLLGCLDLDPIASHAQENPKPARHNTNESSSPFYQPTLELQESAPTCLDYDTQIGNFFDSGYDTQETSVNSSPFANPTQNFLYEHPTQSHQNIEQREFVFSEDFDTFQRGVLNETMIKVQDLSPFVCKNAGLGAHSQKDYVSYSWFPQYSKTDATNSKDPLLSDNVATFPEDKSHIMKFGYQDQEDSINKNNVLNQLEPLIVIEDESDCFSGQVGFSSPLVPCMVDVIVDELTSASNIEEDANSRKMQKNKSENVAAMAEKEACDYGLQVSNSSIVTDMSLKT